MVRIDTLVSRNYWTTRDTRITGWAGIATLPVMLIPVADTIGDFPRLFPTWNETPQEVARWWHTMPRQSSCEPACHRAISDFPN